MSILVIWNKKQLQMRTQNGIVIAIPSTHNKNAPTQLTNMTKEQCITLLSDTSMDVTIREYIINTLNLSETNVASPDVSEGEETAQVLPNTSGSNEPVAQKVTNAPIAEPQTQSEANAEAEALRSRLTGFVRLSVKEKKIKMVLLACEIPKKNCLPRSNELVVTYSPSVANHFANAIRKLPKDPNHDLTDLFKKNMYEKLVTLPSGPPHSKTIETKALEDGRNIIEKVVLNIDQLKILLSQEKVYASWALRHPTEITKATRISPAQVKDKPIEALPVELFATLPEIDEKIRIIDEKMRDTLDHLDKRKNRKKVSIFSTPNSQPLDKEEIIKLLDMITEAYRLASGDTDQIEILKKHAKKLRAILEPAYGSLDRVIDEDKLWLRLHSAEAILLYRQSIINIQSCITVPTTNNQVGRIKELVDKLCDHIDLNSDMAITLKEKLNELKSKLSLNESDNAWIESCMTKLKVVIENSRSKPLPLAQSRPF